MLIRTFCFSLPVVATGCEANKPSILAFSPCKVIQVIGYFPVLCWNTRRPKLYVFFYFWMTRGRVFCSTRHFFFIRKTIIFFLSSLRHIEGLYTKFSHILLNITSAKKVGEEVWESYWASPVDTGVTKLTVVSRSWFSEGGGGVLYSRLAYGIPGLNPGWGHSLPMCPVYSPSWNKSAE